MNCERAKILIDAYSTDELDIAAALDVEEHLKECGTCADELASLRALRSTITGSSLRYAAPAELRARLSADAEDVQVPQTRSSRPRIRRFALAAAIVALLLLPWLAIYWNNSLTSENQLAAEITASHIRSLMSDHLLDVPSTDQHTVHPWFSGKLDFSPPVVDLKNEGFPLIGGRLDYINNRPVAAIVYQRQKHLINLFAWPTASADLQGVSPDSKGYNLLRWVHNGMTYIAVSDVNQEELARLADLLQHGPTTRP